MRDPTLAHASIEHADDAATASHKAFRRNAPELDAPRRDTVRAHRAMVTRRTRESPKKAPKAQPKKAPKAQSKRRRPKVMVVGVRRAGVTTLVRALAPDAAGSVADIGSPRYEVIDARPKARRRAPVEVMAREVILGGEPVVLHDVPGDARGSSARAYDEARFTKLLGCLEAAKVIVHVIDASDPDAERQGGRLDRWIYGSCHDWHAPVIPVLTKCDAVDGATRAALTAVWPDAIAVSAKTGDGLDALGAAIGQAAIAKKQKRIRTGPLARWSLAEIELALIERTRAPTFDGATIASELGTRVRRGEVLGVVFLREGESTYGERDLAREDDGLRFLARVHEGVWDADTLHVMTRTASQAQKLAARAKDRWGARRVEVLRENVVRAVWDVAGLTASTPAGAPSVQDLQMEILARSGFNAFRGDRVAASLAKHPALWRAVAFGRLRTKLEGTPAEHQPPVWLNTVTEMARGYWNADEVWVVAPDAEAAKKIRFLGEVHWFADNIITLEGAEARRVAGVAAPACVVELWWD